MHMHCTIVCSDWEVHHHDTYAQESELTKSGREVWGAAHAELVVTQSSIGRGLARKTAGCTCTHSAHFDNRLCI